MTRRPVLQLAVLFLLAFAFTSCTHHKVAASSSPGGGRRVEMFEGGSGTSFDDAVVVVAQNESDGVAMEYDWLKKNYPGYQLIKQSLVYHDNKPYDVMKIKTSEGKTTEVYFDISNFFGKF